MKAAKGRQIGLIGIASAMLWLASCASPPLTQPIAAENDAFSVIRDGDRILPPAEVERVTAKLAKEGDTDLLRNHLRYAKGTASSPLVLGNTAQLLIDGPATHGAMFAAIAAARDHVNVESYIIADDEAGVKLMQVLEKKAAQGVKVNVLYDSVGSMDTSKDYFQSLRDRGIATCEFNPVNPLKAKGDWRLNNRNHRKILVVDGRTAFTGGINISGVYSAGSAGSRRKSPDEGWRDTHVRIAGPIVADAQKLFVADWERYCGALEKAQYFPNLQRAGALTMRLTAGEPDKGNEIYASLLDAITHAEKSVHLTYGYFVPDPRTIETLKSAAARGVDVTLMLPGFSDFWAPLYAGRSHYDTLLESGVKIYERPDALLHAKTAVIDGTWASIGSTNLDWRSLVHNYEADVVIYSDEFGAQMEKLFDDDVRVSRRVDLESWRDRGPTSRFKEWFARRWGYLL